MNSIYYICKCKKRTENVAILCLFYLYHFIFFK